MRPRLLLLSGWAYPSQALRPLADALAADFDVAIYGPGDLARRRADASTPPVPGREAGPSSYVETLLDLLPKQPCPCLLCGWSLGGLIALEAAARAPGRVSGLVLASAAARFCCDEHYPCGTPERNLRALIVALKKDPARALAPFFVESAAPEKLQPTALQAELQYAFGLGAESLIRDLRYLQHSDWRRLVRGLNLPVLVLHGREDRIIPWQAGQWLCDHFRTSRFVLFDNVGHDLPLRQPRRVAAEITRFRNQLDSSAELHHQSVRHRFSAAADRYESLATVQSTVAEKLIRLLPRSAKDRRILEVGCGTGLLTRHLLGNFPAAVIEAIDVSARMIAAARRRFSAAHGIAWHVADARHFRSDFPFDLIVSNCCLHWVVPLRDGLCNVASLLRPGGELVFSIMLEGTLDELHETRLRVAPHKPPLRRLPRLSEVIESVNLCGCEVVEELEEVEVAHYLSAKDFLRTLHELGLTGGLVSRSAPALNRTQIHAIIADYEARYRDGPRGVRASYKAGYIRAFKRA